MASPSNASDAESSDEEEIIPAGFDFLLFWDQYRQVILLAGGVLLLAVVLFSVYEYNQSQRIAAAGAALAQAANDNDYRQIISKYAGTRAAGDASLFLAAKLRDEKQYDDSLQVLQAFMDKYPDHPLVHAGDLSYAETLEAEGKVDEAVTRYQEVAAKYPDTYSAPVAVIAQANILKAQGKTEEARRLYENFVAQFPDSIFNQEAMAEMHLLRPATGAASSGAAPGTNSEGLSAGGLPNTAAGASASPAAAPSVARPAPSAPPVMPVIPGPTP